jgi:hypothetical protein
MPFFRRRGVLVLVALSLVGATAPAGAVQADTETPRAVAAKSCGAGYVHAVLPTGHKCLRRGQGATTTSITATASTATAAAA